MRITTVGIACAALIGAASVAQADDDLTLRAIGEGRALYLQNCAACHGPHGEGSDAGADGEATAIPDLTRIEERDGSFDRVHIAVHIEGRPEDDGSMPCWQVAFQDEWPRGRDMAILKIWKIARYLDFIQGEVPPTAETPEGGER